MTVQAAVSAAAPGKHPFTRALYTLITYAVVGHVLTGFMRPLGPSDNSDTFVKEDAAATTPVAAAVNTATGPPALFALMADLVQPHGYPLEERFVSSALNAGISVCLDSG